MSTTPQWFVTIAAIGSVALGWYLAYRAIGWALDLFFDWLDEREPRPGYIPIAGRPRLGVDRARHFDAQTLTPNANRESSRR